MGNLRQKLKPVIMRGTSQARGVSTMKKKDGGKAKRKQKRFLGVNKERGRLDPKLKKFLRKKARDYNSEDDDEDMSVYGIRKAVSSSDDDDDKEDVEKEDFGIEIEGSENEEEDEIQPGITKLIKGCRAFKNAFQSIMKKSVSDDSLGPVLSGHKKLLAEKLAEEEAEKKVKGETKKEKQLMAEKGHVEPSKYLASHEKFLISVATKGVVKLFNAVNKAQNAQNGLNPSRSKDAKVIAKRRKEAFFSELVKKPVADTSSKVHTSGSVDGEGPAWAPLRDNYMLTNPKLKDWDKMPDTVEANGIGVMSKDSSSDDD